MPKSPIVSKIRCHSPNKQRSRVCNRNYLVYIATRDGVDLSNPAMERDINIVMNKMEHLDDGSISESSNELYLKYIDERPRSCGLFGNMIFENEKELGNTMADLTANGKNIYRAIISLSGEDAAQLGYDSKEKWIELLNSTMPDVAKEFHIPIDHLKWVGAFHMEMDHPHCHYMFYQDNPHVRSPFIHTSVQQNVREIFSKEIYREEREKEVIRKTMERDLILDLGKELMIQEKDYVSEKLKPGKFTKDQIKEVSMQINELNHKLPGTGRLQYKMLSPDLKVEVDKIVDQVLLFPQFKKELANYENAVSNIAKSYSPSKKREEYIESSALEDLKKRLANQVLRTCKDHLILNEISINYDQLDAKSVDYEMSEPNFSFNEDPGFDMNESNTIDIFVMDWSKSYKEAMNIMYSEEPDFNKCIMLLKQESKNNNVLAFLELGKIYERGIGVDIDLRQAQTYYKKGLEGLHYLEAEEMKTEKQKRLPYIQYKLGKLYESGKGTDAFLSTELSSVQVQNLKDDTSSTELSSVQVQDLKDDTPSTELSSVQDIIQKNYEKAIYYYTLSTNSENKYAQYSLGNMYLREKRIVITPDNQESYHNAILTLFKASADQGFPYACYSFAKFCEQHTTPYSNDVIHAYYKSAMTGFLSMLEDQENDDILYRVGTMYFDGKGTEKDWDKAVEYFLKSATLNNSNAQYAMGKMYADLEYKLYNPIEAEKMFLLAIENRHNFSSLALAKLYLQDNILYNPGKAIAILNELTKDPQNAKNAFYELGKIYDQGKHQPQDIKLAIHYYEKAVDEKNDYAAYSLGKIYMDKESGFYSPDKAEYYLLKSLEKNSENDNTHYALGKLYSDQESPKYNIHLAMAHLLKAAEKDNSYALMKLGSIYLWGKHPGVNKDVDKAMEYLNRSVALGNEHAANTIKMYYDFQSTMAMSMSFSLLQNMFQTLMQPNRKKNIAYDRHQSTSRQNRIAMARRAGLKVHGREKDE